MTEVKTVWQDPETGLYEIEGKTITRADLEKLMALQSECEFYIVEWAEAEPIIEN